MPSSSSAAARRPRRTAPSFTIPTTAASRPPSRSARTGPSSRASRRSTSRRTNYFQRPDERYTLGVFANYEISDAIQPYLEVHVHGRPHGRADRAVGQLRQHLLDQLRRTRRARPVPARATRCSRLQQRAVICAAPNLVTQLLPTGFPLVGGTNAPGDRDAPLIFIDPTTGPALHARLRSARCAATSKAAAAASDLQHTNYPHRRRHARRPRPTSGPTTPTISSARPISPDLLRTTSRSPASAARSTSSTIRARRASIRSAARCSTVRDTTCVPYDIFGLSTVNPGGARLTCRPRASSRGDTKQTVASASLTGNLGE